MAKFEVPTKKMTYEEFLAWCDEDTWAEWVNGEVIVLSPASRRHEDIPAFSEPQGLGKVIRAPFQMKPDLNHQVEGRISSSLLRRTWDDSKRLTWTAQRILWWRSFPGVPLA
ncbi:MAG: hypothetical protein XD60_1711 [Acetothermia bacterium 64_32]|nr:MAG: hypothetical protein XD60_1711 [Acetothermia bacterium 64_32]